MKIVGNGFVFGETAYLRSPWSMLDFAVVVIGILLAAIGDSQSPQLSSLRSLRTLRALRPIRVASRAPGMKARARPHARMFCARARVLAALTPRPCMT